MPGKIMQARFVLLLCLLALFAVFGGSEPWVPG